MPQTIFDVSVYILKSSGSVTRIICKLEVTLTEMFVRFPIIDEPFLLIGNEELLVLDDGTSSTVSTVTQGYWYTILGLNRNYIEQLFFQSPGFIGISCYAQYDRMIYRNGGIPMEFKYKYTD